MKDPIENLAAFNGEDSIIVVIDTPKGSRNKYQFDIHLASFKLGGILPLGHAFPYNFGYIPQTLGGDGDPLDVLVLLEEPVFVGCVVECRLIGGLEAYQTEKEGKVERNDRLLGVAHASTEYANIKKLSELGDTAIEQITHFFTSYNNAKGKKFEVRSHLDEAEARRIIEEAMLKK